MSHLNGSSKSATSMRMMLSDRPMPIWLNETHDRSGPKPPAVPPSNQIQKHMPPPPLPRKKQIEPDYEVIEFSNQQYSNATQVCPKTTDVKRTDGLKCQLCGSSNPWVSCDQCGNQIFCASCDDMFHKHPKRQSHVRKAMEKSQSIKPPLPPKTDLQFSAPVPPPRRNKKAFPSPLPVRRDQSGLLTQQNGTLKRPTINISNRPLPETPTQALSSRSSTPNSKSVFDSIQRPPSITLEKIKSKASATFNKMALLQQRYRQHQELKGDGSKINSTTQLNDQMSDWSIPSSLGRLRSGSMSSGMNSIPNQRSSVEASFPNYPPTIQHSNHMDMMHKIKTPIRTSTSVFNLNQIGNQRQIPINQGGWNSIGQAQSMAQINCAGCNHQGWNHCCGRDGWMDGSSQNLHGSNMSLNMPHGYYPSQQHAIMGPPPTWFNNWNGPSNMYPYPYPMMNGMMTLPRPPRSRVGSRAGSPALSIKSRKSMMSNRHKRSSYVEHELTDDEDSEDDRRSIRSHRSEVPGQRRKNTRKNSLTSHSFDEEIDEFNLISKPRSKLRPSLSESRNKNENTANSQKLSAPSGLSSHKKPVANLIRNRIERESNSSKGKGYSDSPLTQDSENEPPTKALVQAKIQEKLSKERESQIKTNQTLKKSALIPKPESNIEESEEEEENELSDKDNKNDSNQKTHGEVPQLGPPPSTPDHDWECEFCTYVNEANVKICAVCCKTPIRLPIKSENFKKAPPKKLVEKWSPSTSNLLKQNIDKNTKSSASTNTATVTAKESRITTKKSDEKNIEKASRKINSAKNSQSEEDSEQPLNETKKKDGIIINNNMSLEDIWASLEEDIKNAAEATKRNNERKFSVENEAVSYQQSIIKTSTACGPSPPREVSQRRKINQSISTGTSPPPQSISTQTYDVLPIPKQHNIEHINDEQFFKSGRSYSIASPSQHSLPPTPPLRHMSPVGIRKYNNESNLMDSDLMVNYNERNYFQYNRDIRKRDRYRSNSELRQDESYLSRRPSIGDMLSYQKSQIHSNDIIPSQWDSYDIRKRDIKPRDAGMELVILLKEAEHYKFTAEELQAALKHCGDTHPILWLRENWAKLIKTVQTLATKYGQEQKENIIGTIASIEAREALRTHRGNVWHAVTECIEQRQKKFREIACRSNYSREDIVTALTAHHGNIELALIDLGKMQIKPFLMRIWGSPTGVENDSGNLSLDFDQKPNNLDIDPSIHNFLNANAETLQLLKMKEFRQQSNSPHQYHNQQLSKHPSKRDLGSLSNLSITSFGNRTEFSEGFDSPSDAMSINNPNLLKDIEILIASMEQNQAKQNESMLKSIENILGGLLECQNQQQQSEPIKQKNEEQFLDPSDLLNEMQFTGEDHIFRKSPILKPKLKNYLHHQSNSVEENVKNFVSQHIQDIIPDLVEHVERELEENDSNHYNKDNENFTLQSNEITSNSQVSEIVMSINDDFAAMPISEIDIKNFVSKHIKDIVPDLVGQVRKELQQEAENEKSEIGRQNQEEQLKKTESQKNESFYNNNTKLVHVEQNNNLEEKELIYKSENTSSVSEVKIDLSEGKRETGSKCIGNITVTSPVAIFNSEISEPLPITSNIKLKRTNSSSLKDLDKTETDQSKNMGISTLNDIKTETVIVTDENKNTINNNIFESELPTSDSNKTAYNKLNQFINEEKTETISEPPVSTNIEPILLVITNSKSEEDEDEDPMVNSVIENESIIQVEIVYNAEKLDSREINFSIPIESKNNLHSKHVTDTSGIEEMPQAQTEENIATKYDSYEKNLVTNNIENLVIADSKPQTISNVPSQIIKNNQPLIENSEISYTTENQNIQELSPVVSDYEPDSNRNSTLNLNKEISLENQIMVDQIDMQTEHLIDNDNKTKVKLNEHKTLISLNQENQITVSRNLKLEQSNGNYSAQSASSTNELLTTRTSEVETNEDNRSDIINGEPNVYLINSDYLNEPEKHVPDHDETIHVAKKMQDVNILENSKIKSNYSQVLPTEVNDIGNIQENAIENIDTHPVMFIEYPTMHEIFADNLNLPNTIQDNKNNHETNNIVIPKTLNLSSHIIEEATKSNEIQAKTKIESNNHAIYNEQYDISVHASYHKQLQPSQQAAGKTGKRKGKNKKKQIKNFNTSAASTLNSQSQYKSERRKTIDDLTLINNDVSANNTSIILQNSITKLDNISSGSLLTSSDNKTEHHLSSEALISNINASTVNINLIKNTHQTEKRNNILFNNSDNLQITEETKNNTLNNHNIDNFMKQESTNKTEIAWDLISSNTYVETTIKSGNDTVSEDKNKIEEKKCNEVLSKIIIKKNLNPQNNGEMESENSLLIQANNQKDQEANFHCEAKNTKVNENLTNIDCREYNLNIIASDSNFKSLTNKDELTEIKIHVNREETFLQLHESNEKELEKLDNMEEVMEENSDEVIEIKNSVNNEGTLHQNYNKNFENLDNSKEVIHNKTSQDREKNSQQMPENNEKSNKDLENSDEVTEIKNAVNDEENFYPLHQNHNENFEDLNNSNEITDNKISQGSEKHSQPIRENNEKSNEDLENSDEIAKMKNSVNDNENSYSLHQNYNEKFKDLDSSKEVIIHNKTSKDIEEHSQPIPENNEKSNEDLKNLDEIIEIKNSVNDQENFPALHQSNQQNNYGNVEEVTENNALIDKEEFSQQLQKKDEKTINIYVTQNPSRLNLLNNKNNKEDNTLNLNQNVPHILKEKEKFSREQDGNLINTKEIQMDNSKIDLHIPQISITNLEKEYDEIFKDVEELIGDSIKENDKDNLEDLHIQEDTSDEELFSIQSDEDDYVNLTSETHLDQRVNYPLENSFSVASFASTDGFISPTISNSEVILIFNSNSKPNRESAVISIDKDTNEERKPLQNTKNQEDDMQETNVLSAQTKNEENLINTNSEEHILLTSEEDVANIIRTKVNSKQNLTELVENTQKLIKQMKEEINFDIASFEEDDDYSDDWTDDYDDEEGFDEEEETSEEEYDEEDYESEEYSDTQENYNQEDFSENVEDESFLMNDETQNINSQKGDSNKLHLPVENSLEAYDLKIAGIVSNQFIGESLDSSNKKSEVYEATDPKELPNNVKLNKHTKNVNEKNIHNETNKNDTDKHRKMQQINESTPQSIIEYNVQHETKLDENILTQHESEFLQLSKIIKTQEDVSLIDERNGTQMPENGNSNVKNEGQEDYLGTSLVDNTEEVTPDSNNGENINIKNSKHTLESNDSSSDWEDYKTKQNLTETITKDSISNINTSISIIKNLEVESIAIQPSISNKIKSKNMKKTETCLNSSKKSESDDSVANNQKAKPTLNKITIKASTGAISKIPKLALDKSRSKSFSGPAIITSVKKIQLELFNKQEESNKTARQSKLTPPRVIRKNSITETITKLMASKQTPLEILKNNQRSASTSAETKIENKVTKIPKKKYHETCFSDENPSSSSEDESPIMQERLRRKQSEPVFRTYPSLIQDAKIEPVEVMAKKFIQDGLCSNYAEAELAAALVELKFQQDAALWAARECNDLEQAISLLQQECELCTDLYPMNEIVSMLKCTHACCKDCAKNYFTIQITDRSINDCNCPYCKVPELHDPDANEDEILEYFSNLDIFLKNILDKEVHELFQRKLRDRSLTQDPNFKWCVQCSSGFFARPKQKRLICPDCGSITCAQCRKPWEKQHDGLSCDKYQEWLDSNDPDKNIQGVLQHLATNGIDCPKCKFRFSLARGGCMHFTCTQCKYEFCYGCGKPFMMGAKCTVSPYCARLGLHSHHPRNCLFYLRDKEPKQLQDLLRLNKLSFDVEPQIEKSDLKTKQLKCPVPLQKETPSGLIDTICNGDVSEKHAGLCRQHYVEYLVREVSKANIDPLPILDLTDCVQELRRRGISLPERGPWDTDEIYRGMCSKIVEAQIPLN